MHCKCSSEDSQEFATVNYNCVFKSNNCKKIIMDTQHKVIVTCTVVSIGTLAFWLWFWRKTRKQEIPKNWRLVGKVSDLHLYPLKSGKRVELKEAECDTHGLVQITDKVVHKLADRSFIVYGNGVKEGTYEFKTARTFPKMVLIEVSNHDIDHIALDAPNMRTLYVKVPQTKNSEVRTLTMHSQEPADIVDCGDEAGAWLSRYIKGEESGLRLGYHDKILKHRSIRPFMKDLKKFYPYFKTEDMGLYSDLTSFMLMTKTSVTDLNTRLNKDVTCSQFRPNILIDKVDKPYVEEKWDWIKIGEDVVFRNIKPCTRCVFVTIDDETGIMDPQKEPLKTLKTYRQLEDEEERKASHDSPVMGINLGLRKPGIIRIDDNVYVNA